MAIFVWQNSCFDHDNIDYCMLNCLLCYNACTTMSIAIANPFVNPTQLGLHNKITCGCILNVYTVQKDHEKFNLLVLTRSTCLMIGYLFKNNNPMLIAVKNTSFRYFSGFFFPKNIKNHGFNGPTLKTEVFNVIFLLDLDLEMSTKSCARTLKNMCFSDIEHPQKTALKNTFFECDNQNFFKIITVHLLYFKTSGQTPFLIDSLCHNTRYQKTMYFSWLTAPAQPMIMVNLT